MKLDEQSTQKKILSVAKKEFLRNGFLNASLRNIAKNAGVTTGALYRYYTSKEDLFEALVSEPAEHVLHMFTDTVDDFEKLSGREQTKQMKETSTVYIMDMLDYIYDNYDSFKLLIQCSEGTSYGNFIHQMVEREVNSTYSYIEVLQSMGHKVEPINKDLCHIIASGMFTGLFETIVHDMKKQDAKIYVSQMRKFYTAGWSELLGVKFGE